MNNLRPAFFKRSLPLFLVLLLLFPGSGRAAGAPDWQAQAAEAMTLANEAGLAVWLGSLPMLWTEPDAVRQTFAPGVREDLLFKVRVLLQNVRARCGNDNRVLFTLAAVEACLGRRESLADLVAENGEGRQDFRQAMLDLALYLREWDLAERLLGELEARSVQAGLTYRRAILAGLTDRPLLCASLWREALSEGLPVTQAVYKDLFKAGLGDLAAPPALSSRLRSYLDTLAFFEQRTSARMVPFLPAEFCDGIAAYEAGRYEEALRCWQTGPVQPELRGVRLCLIGEAQNRLGRYADALRTWNEAVKFNPDLFLGYKGLAEALQHLGFPEKARECLRAGFHRTNSVFLLDEAAVVPPLLKEAAGTVRPGTRTGFNLVEVSGESGQGADGLWISWNYGRDWLWYPSFLNRLQIPAGAEYWLKGNGPSQTCPDQVLRPKRFAKPEPESSLSITGTNCGDSPEVDWRWNQPVELRFEYWTKGGPRFIVNDPPQGAHRIFLENAEPGRVYRYRAIVMKDGREVALEEGEFTTEAAPLWVAVVRPPGASSLRVSRLRLPVGLEELGSAAPALEVRWAQSDGPWTGWMPARPELSVDLPDGEGKKIIQLQFRDRAGRISPVLHEEFQLDHQPPRLAEIRWRESGAEKILSWSTDESTVGTVWFFQDGQWQAVSLQEGYATEHTVALPVAARDFQIWAEDRAGNIAAGPGGEGPGLPPVALRINGGDEVVAKREVLLSVNQATGSTAGSGEVRFSNDGMVWSPWEPVREERRWLLSGGEGEKTVFARIKTENGMFTLKAKVFLDLTLPRPQDVSFRWHGGQAVVTWRTPEPSRCRFYWGTGRDDVRLFEEDRYATEHTAVLGETVSGRYIWRLEAQDEAGNLAVLTDGWWSSDGDGVFAPPMAAWELSPESKGRQNVTLRFQPAGSAPAAVRLRIRGCEWSEWKEFQPDLRWTLLPDQEVQWIEVQFKGENGWISPISSQQVELDLRPPRAYGLGLRSDADGLRLVWRTDKKTEAWILLQRLNGENPEADLVWTNPGLAFSGEILLGKLAPGSYRLRLFVTDAEGNWHWSPWLSFQSSG